MLRFVYNTTVKILKYCEFKVRAGKQLGPTLSGEQAFVPAQVSPTQSQPEADGRGIIRTNLPFSVSASEKEVAPRFTLSEIVIMIVGTSLVV